MAEEKLDQETRLDLGKLLGFKRHASFVEAIASPGFVHREHLARMLGATCNKIGVTEVPD
jgi:hypothetical protein